jgi:hypothetical protein
MRKTHWATLATIAMLAATAAPAAAQADRDDTVRFATFNASLNRNFDGQLQTELSSPGNTQAEVIAEIIQRSNPDVLLINEFDYDAANIALDGFADNYLAVAQADGVEGIDYPYRFTAPSNTGIHSGFDLDNSGTIDRS